jgi:hypothetical protein
MTHRVYWKEQKDKNWSIYTIGFIVNLLKY